MDPEDRENGGDAEVLARLAAAIADGKWIDWSRERQQHPHLIEALARLESLEKLASRCQMPPDSGSTQGSALEWSTVPIAIPQPPFTWGHLEVRDQVDEGASSIVFCARDPKLDLEVALKLFKSQCEGAGKQQFIAEARRLALVRHPNVVTVHGVAEHEGLTGIWMELVKGQNLEQRLQRGKFSENETAVIGADLCRALAAIHANGLVHGDLKSTNVMRRESDGKILLMDFGCVREISSHQAARRYGTPVYMAPEVLLERRAPDLRADLYSLGVLMYHLVTKQFPVEARNLEELEAKHRRQESIPIIQHAPHLSRDFVRIVQCALERDPDLRYQSVGSVHEELGRFLLPNPRRRFERFVRWLKSYCSRPVVRFSMATSALAGLAIAAWLHLNAPLRVEAEVFRLRDNRAEPLGIDESSEVRVGEEIFLRVRASKTMHFYVLKEAAASGGTVRVDTLFPSPYLVTNPLAKKTDYRIPDSDSQILWEADGTPGTEKLLFIAATRPLESLKVRGEIVARPRTTRTQIEELYHKLLTDYGEDRNVWLRLAEMRIVASMNR